ncbi:hypothetical protein [Candidatus Nitrosocosmicus sp. SS]|uniref:hypothetical protein n=1 Tax=Candidatus Nitrosocosmicus agrestis TaxID=2563600 RepID=UPI00122DCAC2|nr:hypothetical protein [Candidatus Nitrosocosmicus sp. SS]KAA2283485.1 hypothetical protein F1Z66_00960 [Candidatus Nitrosocosmicus sp. SS]KAF0869567.1 hypothetical protein E5N71_03500 [Candidatus Nitrosocosmicus sp. SS]MDR4490315.1 hypothetical protein [Candidatus Nitrosocosmicus sp.]
MKDSSSYEKYDNLKHLVEVNDDILAVFSIVSSDMKELYVAKNANIDKSYIESLIRILNLTQVTSDEKENKTEKDFDIILGDLKWIVIEYEKMRILKILEKDKTIYVLINSNIQLEDTVDNILGYYYELDEIPKSLF